MRAEAFARQGQLPVALHRTTGEPLPLSKVLEEPDAAVPPAELDLDRQIALVSARWRAGAWDDIYYGTEGEVDLDRAIREIEAQSDMGRHLLAIGLRAIEMAREDADKAEEG